MWGRYFPSTLLNKDDGLVHIVYRNHGIRLQTQCRADLPSLDQNKWLSSKRVVVYERPHVPTCLWCIVIGRGY